MLGKIIEINNNQITVELTIDIVNQPNIIGIHLIFEDGNRKIVAEVESVNKTSLKANIVGEFTNKQFSPGTVSKPSFKSNIRVINIEELEILLGKQQLVNGEFYLGNSNIYENYHINIDMNSFFSNHFSILGNSGSGKSYTVAAFIQRIFTRNTQPPLGANIFLFDAYGEYTKSFSHLHDINQNLNYKIYTTNTESSTDELVRVPLWLLDVDDLALLLDVDNPNQLPIIEKTLRLVPVLIENSPDVIKHKNNIISRALQDILLSGDESTKIRDQVTAILTKFNTEELNLESKIVEPGYTRTLKQCLYIDKTGKMQEMELVVNFITTFINDNLTLEKSNKNTFYTLKDLESAMEFALISEGMLKSNRVYDIANVLLVRLHTLANSPASEYFTYEKFISMTDYIKGLLIKDNNSKCQIVNFNISYIDDRLAKVITKIISRMLFKQSVVNPNRGSVPFHIIIEEAHRYVQKDKDLEILGYNIFERITKEGRKYGIILGLITQRPSELSDTVISQCSNFLILRMSHPKDLEYIRTMVPNVSDEIVEKIKNLKPGNCIAFGVAFKIPINMYVQPPNPTPLSNNVDMVKIWYEQSNLFNQIDTVNQVVPEITNLNNNLSENENQNVQVRTIQEAISETPSIIQQTNQNVDRQQENIIPTQAIPTSPVINSTQLMGDINK